MWPRAGKARSGSGSIGTDLGLKPVWSVQFERTQVLFRGAGGVGEKSEKKLAKSGTLNRFWRLETEETLDDFKVSCKNMTENAELKEKIVEGASGLFLRYGIRSVSMDDIASQLGISKKTIYQVFEDKDELVQGVTSYHLKRQTQEFEDAVAQSRDDVEGLVNLSICMRKNFKDINPAVLFDLFKYHRKSWDVWVNYKSEVIRRTIADQIKSGIEHGYFRKEIDPEIVGIFRVEQVQIAFDENVYPRDKFNFVNVQMQLFDLFVFGILTDKGRALYYQYKKTITPEQTVKS